MLIPQFSLRWLLAVTTLVAVAFSFVGMAVRGHHWALAVSAALLAVVVLFAVYLGAFVLLWLFSLIPSRRVAESPFQSVPHPSHASETPAEPFVLRS